MNKLFSVVLLCSVSLAFSQSTNYATRVTCEVQSSYPELRDLVWLQGTTPAVQAVPLNAGKPLAYDASTSVRMVIGPTATGTNFAVRTNAASVTNGYTVQWPTIGTNSSTNAWFYTLLFDRAGQTYWSGSGKLYIDATTSTASNGLEWIEYTIPSVAWENIVGDASNNASLVAYVESHSGGSAVDDVARAGVASNTANIVLASNVAATAYGWGNHALAGYLSRYSSNTVIDAGTNALFRNNSGKSYFINSTNSGDLLFSPQTGLELEMNDGDIDGVADFQVATISPRPGGDAPEFLYGFRIGGVTYTNLNLSGGDASAWSAFPATNSFVDFNDKSMTNVSRIYGQTVSIHADDVDVYGNVSANNLIAHSSITLGDVEITEWPSGTGATFTVEGGTNVTVATNGSSYVVSSSGAASSSVVPGVESSVAVLSWATNITLLAGTNAVAQKIESIGGTTTITIPNKASTNTAAIIWLTMPSIGTNAVGWVTNLIYGYVPTFSTNSKSEFLYRSPVGSAGGYMRRIR